jgi:opacity protein-like surface antigen
MGPGWEAAGQTQTINLAPDVVKTYTANQPTNVFPSAELFVGLKNALPKQLEGQLGLVLITTADATLSGNVWDDGMAEFNNYTYQYNVTRTAVGLKGKLLGQWGSPIIPWISATLGMSFNQAHNFSSTPTIFEAVAMPNFASNTTTAFTYAVGIGGQYQLKPNWQLGAGYEFSDWGKSQLGSAGNTSNGPSLSHLYSNSLLFNLTYVA